MIEARENQVPRTVKTAPVSGALFLLVDAVTMLYSGCVYFAAFAGPAWALWAMRHAHPLLLLATALAGWHAAALVFSLMLILTKRLVVGNVPPGRFRLTGRRAGRWIAADRIMKIMLRSPFRALITENGFHRLFFYRGMGARIDATLLMGNGSKFPEPWAVTVGRNVVVGNGATLSGHKVEGNIVTLGTVEVGDGVLVGANSVVFPDVRIGDGAVIGAGSVVTRGTTIPPGETWAGNPAVRVMAFPAARPANGAGGMTGGAPEGAAKQSRRF